MEDLILESFRAQEAGGQGDGFEKICLFPLRSKLIDALRVQFGDAFRDLHVSEKSAYGVLVRKCKGQSNQDVTKTLEWLKDARKAKFEGTVPPFCFPDDLFGPDIVFILRDKAFRQDSVMFVLCQSKYRTEQNQEKALATVTPTLLYNSNRLNEKKRKLAPWEPLNKSWGPLLRLAFETDPCVRVLVQYPVMANQDSAAAWGLHKESHTSTQRCNTSECSKVHDWLFTIHGGNAASFFSQDVMTTLNHGKRHSLDLDPATKSINQKTEKITSSYKQNSNNYNRRTPKEPNT